VQVAPWVLRTVDENPRRDLHLPVAAGRCRRPLSPNAWPRVPRRLNTRCMLFSGLGPEFYNNMNAPNNAFGAEDSKAWL
jgi:hypothetical protein